MNFISIDLGTTNVKVCIYDQQLHMLDLYSHNVAYDRDGLFVEFQPEVYFDCIADMLKKAARKGKEINGKDVAQIILTGQAESLILLNEHQKPVYPGISWMDMRSSEECEELSEHFSSDTCFQITGQPELIPTWPVTKILWMKKHKPEVTDKTHYYLLLKDYIVLRLCGNLAGDHSIYGFSHYFDIQKKCYWEDILNYCGVSEAQLPPLMPSGSIAGTLLPELCIPDSGLTAMTKINIGTLDHFAGMIGTGSIQEGQISESAGTVLSIAAITKEPVINEGRLPNYCGPFPNSYVLLPVCESGGFSMEWFKKQFLEEISYTELNEVLRKRMTNCVPVFLPYLTGVNSPDYEHDACGTFFGIHAHHDKFDMALSIMEGVACLLKRNIDYFEKSGLKIEKIISTGGGAKSPVWTQLKANITGHTIEVPANEEAPCLGAAIMGAVTEGVFSSYEDAIQACIKIKGNYIPSSESVYQKTYQLFLNVYTSLLGCFHENASREKE